MVANKLDILDGLRGQGQMQDLFSVVTLLHVLNHSCLLQKHRCLGLPSLLLFGMISAFRDLDFSSAIPFRME